MGGRGGGDEIDFTLTGTKRQALLRGNVISQKMLNWAIGFGTSLLHCARKPDIPRGCRLIHIVQGRTELHGGKMFRLKLH